MANKYKLVRKSKIDFNKDLDNVSAKIKSESEKEVTTPLSQTSVKVEIQPNDKVIFNGKAATVVSSFPNGEIVILQDGMTIECEKKQVEVYGKIDTMDVPMKFKDGLPVSEKVTVRCNLVGESSPLNLVNENLFVDFSEWKRKKGKQRVRIISEDYEETFDAPKQDVMLLELPDGNIGQTDGYVPGVIVSSEDEAERKVMIKAADYATSTDDSDEIPVLFFTENGYKDGTAPKSILKTLSV